MANLVTLTCTACTLSKNGGYILTLKSEVVPVATAFGTVMQNGNTYHMKVATPVAINQKGALDMDQFQVTEIPFIVPLLNKAGQPNPNAGETIPSKWLFLPSVKVAA